MSDKDKPKPSIFAKMLEVGTAVLDAQLHKAKTSIIMNQEGIDDEFYYAKAITEDPTYAINAAGWKEKPYRLQDGHLKQMAQKDSVIAAVIQTRQNQVANHSSLVKSEKERGWMICLRDEEELLEKIKEELKESMGMGDEEPSDGEDQLEVGADEPSSDDFNKADPTGDAPVSSSDLEPEADSSAPGKDGKDDDEVEEYNWELERKAKEKLDSQFKDARKKVQEYIKNCGLTENRPFDTKKWNLDAALRAWVRDTLTYDRYATEIVPDRAGRIHHWFPIDAGTIKYASNRLKDYKQIAENFINLDILYPEKKVEAIEKQKVLELKEDLLAKDAYKYVQVIRGKIERAYTEDELKLGIRNITTDIYNNGYGVGELELVVSLVTGHLNAEFYNQSYFTQGFSAKGILHIQSALNRRKVETVRQQWQHMLRGARNSFQTPIFAGMEDVKWIPLTQNHNDIGFEGWMRYLVKMICSIFQIDPFEIGIGFKDEGGKGSGGLGGDNTQEKMDQSKDKGLFPLILHIETYINENIIKPFDKRFIIKFTGVTTESRKEALERQEKEVKFKKTVNEIRSEDGLPPLPGMDDVILDAQYMSWFSSFSKKAMEQQEKDQQAQADAMAQANGDEGGGEEDNSFYGKDLESNLIKPQMAEVPGEPKPKKMAKSKRLPRRVKVEYYKMEK